MTTYKYQLWLANKIISFIDTAQYFVEFVLNLTNIIKEVHLNLA
jgi:hypothetical protein